MSTCSTEILADRAHCEIVDPLLSLRPDEDERAPC
jgi:hypothetical protein